MTGDISTAGDGRLGVEGAWEKEKERGALERRRHTDDRDKQADSHFALWWLLQAVQDAGERQFTLAPSKALRSSPSFLLPRHQLFLIFHSLTPLSTSQPQNIHSCVIHLSGFHNGTHA